MRLERYGLLDSSLMLTPCYSTMEKDHIYERKFERARRRLRVAVRGPRSRAIHVPVKSNRIELPVKLKAFLGEVDDGA